MIRTEIRWEYSIILIFEIRHNTHFGSIVNPSHVVHQLQLEMLYSTQNMTTIDRNSNLLK